jgi:hypothetical protein
MNKLPVAFVGLVTTSVLIAGCSSVPTSSAAQALANITTQAEGNSSSGPPANVDALTLVRAYVSANANAANNYAAGRAYLSIDAQAKWNAAAKITIIDDSFNTVPTTVTSSSNTVQLKGKTVGHLDADGGFEPDSGDYAATITTQKQADGQWRITTPPEGIVLTQTSFTQYYRAIRPYFFSQQDIPVPDLRYVWNSTTTPDMVNEIMTVLAAGPSTAMTSALTNAIPGNARVSVANAAASDGSLSINLTNLGEQSQDAKTQLAQQIVLSLQNVATNPLRLEIDGQPLFADHPTWKSSDIPTDYQSEIVPASSAPGMYVKGGKLYLLPGTDAYPGDTAPNVVAAAQSIDGTELATVNRDSNGVALRIGKYGQALLKQSDSFGSLSRPTWLPKSANSPYEAWTIADKQQLLRFTSRDGTTWTQSTVDITELTNLGSVTSLRASRDGTRVAAVIGGQLVIAAVTRQNGQVSITTPRIIGGGSLTSVTDVDWQDQSTVIASTTSNSAPVVRISVDGETSENFSTNNLTAPLSSITAAPGRSVIVVDANNTWQAPDKNDFWRPVSTDLGKNVVPFYPG